MKSINYLFITSALIFAVTSCIENSSKYKTLMAEKDSLQVQANTIENSYNETIDILNDVETGFQTIRESEGKMLVDLNSEGQTSSKKAQIAAEIEQIKEIIAQNRTKIAQLERKLNQNGKENKSLAETIERIQNELNEKSALVATLQEQLNQKEIKIGELTQTVTSLTSNVEQLTQKTENQEQVINTQDKDLNTVWYCIATRKELKQAKIYSGGAVLTDKKGGADMNLFVKADLRNLPSIYLNSSSAKILSVHPEGSYAFEKGEDKILTLIIKDPVKFWSISKYLVIKK